MSEEDTSEKVSGLFQTSCLSQRRITFPALPVFLISKKGSILLNGIDYLQKRLEVFNFDPQLLADFAL